MSIEPSQFVRNKGKTPLGGYQYHVLSPSRSAAIATVWTLSSPKAKLTARPHGMNRTNKRKGQREKN